MKKEVVGLNIDDESVKETAKVVDDLTDEIKKKLDDLKLIDDERGLFSLNKAVKEVAVYPPAFGGDPSENVYIFLDKMLEALTANQVREKDKVDVLRKHLKGNAYRRIDESYKTYKEASAAMITYFGNAHTTWKGLQADFVKRCKNTKIWQAKGTKERLNIVADTCAFLRRAEKLASYSSDLERVVNSMETINLLITVVPEDVKRDAFKKSLEEHQKSGNTEKEISVLLKLKQIRIVLETEHALAHEDKTHADAVQENSQAFNSFLHSVQSPDSKADLTTDHDCKTSKACNTKWGALGCKLVYEIPTNSERMGFLKDKRLCMFCGKHYHKPPRYKPCLWDHTNLAVKCTNLNCNIGAAS